MCLQRREPLNTVLKDVSNKTIEQLKKKKLEAQQARGEPKGHCFKSCEPAVRGFFS